MIRLIIFVFFLLLQLLFAMSISFLFVDTDKLLKKVDRIEKRLNNKKQFEEGEKNEENQ